jgi:hypothetical protein
MLPTGNFDDDNDVLDDEPLDDSTTTARPTSRRERSTCSRFAHDRLP